MQRHIQFAGILACLVVLGGFPSPARAADPPSAPQPPGASQPAPDMPPARIASPDGAAAVRILEQAMPGADDPLLDFFTLEVLQGDKVVARAPTMGYLMSAHWSPDGRLVAINNRRGNQGDYLWVFSLPDGACLKRPDDALGARWAGAAMAEIEDQVKEASATTLNRNWITSDGWSPAGELNITVRARYRGPGTFDFTAPVTLRNGKLVIQTGVVKPVK